MILRILLCSSLFLCAQVWGSSWWPWAKEESSKTFNLSRVLEFEQILSSQVIEQPYAVKAVADMLIAYQAGIHDRNRPIGSLLFIGTTGVGKTELAKTLAREITFHSGQFIRFDMTEFSAKESGIYRLIGVPWGYQGSDKGGQLSNAILANPYAIVLLDEFEKAYSDVKLLFLHIFDEGYFTTAKGEYVDCKNCIFIATTNACSRLVGEGWSRGLNYEQVMNCIEPSIMSEFTPELYSRMQPVLFRNITISALKQIVDVKLAEVAAQLKEKRDIEVSFDASVAEYVLSQCHEYNGARCVSTVIKRGVLVAIARALVENHCKKGDRLLVMYDGSSIRVIF